IKTVQERVKRLEQISRKLASLQDYQTSLDIKDIAERNLQVAIEACLDIAKIIISTNDLPEPKDNKGVFTVLAEAGILSKKTLLFLVPMAGTRNVLVHGYDKVEDSIMYDVIKRHLDDFAEYLREVKNNFLNAAKSTDRDSTPEK
ncbi:MAG: DUF86 domain-containing protein, partial [Deltaproteobacteria bacterium]